jgi:hypothetical protein
MPMSEVEYENMDDIISDIHAAKWNWFTCHLLRLIAKSDWQNRAKLAQVYPDEVQAFEQWRMVSHPLNKAVRTAAVGQLETFAAESTRKDIREGRQPDELGKGLSPRDIMRRREEDK